MNTKSVDLKGIIHRYGSSLVLKNIDFSLDKNKIAVLYGANGSGKTTLLRIIATALGPTKGSGTVCGFPLKETVKIRQQTLLISHNLGFYPELTAEENLIFSSTMQLGKVEKEEIPAILAKVGLDKNKNRVRSFSSGMKKRLSLAKILLLKPKLILFDEPFASLDPKGKDMTEEILLTQKETTIIIASHEPERTKKFADVEFFLVDGKINAL